MRRDDDDAPSTYSGSFVVLRPTGLDYTVSVEPPLASNPIAPRVFADKHSAFGEAKRLWQAHRLPFRDHTDLSIGLTNASGRQKSSEENSSNWTDPAK